MNKKFILVLFFTFVLVIQNIFADPRELVFLKWSYPDIEFNCSFDQETKDYLIIVTLDDRKERFYWADGRMLPKEQLANKEKYTPIFYDYPDEIANPDNFTQEDIEYIKDYSLEENRVNGPSFSYFLYDFIYQSSKRVVVEDHLVKTKFLGKRVSIHERIVEPLKKVEDKVFILAQTDPEVQSFLKSLQQIDCYNWRNIEDSGKKSVHSIGIALDLLTKDWGQKNVYWAWRRDLEGDKWITLPLKSRWLVPDNVVKIFEEEGFVYGAKWIIWDNMHFEYFPEIILYNKVKNIFSN